MAKAYLDTTILTDILLKKGDSAKTAKRALKRFDATELPVYAIKEFKQGPLSYYVWIHNKLVVTKSYSKAMDALHRMSRTPKRYQTSTAIEALRDAGGSLGKKTAASLTKKYGEVAILDSILCDEFRLSIKALITKAWKARKKITSDVTHDLECYDQVAPYEDKHGALFIKPVVCRIDKAECCMSKQLKKKPDDLKKLKKANDKLPESRERTRRGQALRQLYRKPKDIMTEEMCRSLGDAIFSFFAPKGSVILTTNKRDHEPLARALGKKVETP